jgi:hypothetical protein
MVGRWLVVVAWLYIVVLMAAAEAMSPNGSILGAVVTLLLYGVGPLALLWYLLGTPARRRRRAALAVPGLPGDSPPRAARGAVPARPPERSAAPDGRDHAPGDAIAPEREEP